MDASGGAAALVGDMHAGGGDIDSLLSTDPEGVDKGRRLGEPYERHRAHDLRAECYRRGLRPVKKGPLANDNKGGYILLLRRYDGTPGGLRDMDGLDGTRRHEDGDGGDTGGDDDGEDDGEDDGGESSHSMGLSPHNGANKKRKLLPPHLSAAALGMGQSLVGLGGGLGGGGGASDLTAASTSASSDLQGFYEAAQAPGLVPVLAMQYTASGMTAGKPSTGNSTGNATGANTATDLEILSGIANTYTQNAPSDGQLCGSCRTVVTDQLMESIRLGRSRMQLDEWRSLAEQRDRDTRHLRDVLAVVGELRTAFREVQADGIDHDLLVELEDDLAFFRELKERAKERMRRAAQDAQARAAAKNNATA